MIEDAKDEMERLTTPHLHWFYGPFSKDKLPPQMPKKGDWIITMSVNSQVMIRFNVGKFHSLDVDRFYYQTASCTLTDMLEWIAGYAFLPPLKFENCLFAYRRFQTIVPAQIWLHRQSDPPRS